MHMDMATAGGGQFDYSTNQINIYIKIIEHTKTCTVSSEFYFPNIFWNGKRFKRGGVVSIFIAADKIKHELLNGSPHTFRSNCHRVLCARNACARQSTEIIKSSFIFNGSFAFILYMFCMCRRRMGKGLMLLRWCVNGVNFRLLCRWRCMLDLLVCKPKA